MKPIAQTKNFCTCLYGYTLPKFCLYGNIYGTMWYCTEYLTPVKINGRDVYRIHIFRPSKKDPQRGSWSVCSTSTAKNGGAIYVRIRDFVKTQEFIAEKPVFCEHRVAKARELERAAEKAERDIKRSRAKAERELLEVAPKLRKVNYHYTPDSRTYYELAVRNGKTVNDFPIGGDAAMRHDHKDHMRKVNMSLQYTHEKERICNFNGTSYIERTTKTGTEIIKR